MGRKILGYFIGLALFLGVAYVGIQWFVNSQVEEGLGHAVAGVPNLNLAYSNLDVDLAARTLELDNVILGYNGQTVTVEKVLIERFDERNPTPHFVRGQALGVVLDRERADGFGLGSIMDSLDLETLRCDLELDYEYEPVSKLLQVRSTAVRMPDVGNVEGSMTLGNLDLADDRLEKFIGVELVALRLRVEDHSLVERVLSSMGRMSGRDAAWAGVGVDRSLAKSASAARRDDNPEASAVLENFRQFLREPEVAVLTAAPKQPVPLAFLFMGRKLGDNLRLMGVTVDLESSANRTKP